MISWFKERFVENQDNDVKALQVETQLVESGFTEEYTSNQTDTTLITPSSGNQLVITDIFIQTESNSGIVELDLDGIKVGRLYASVINRVCTHVGSIKGGADNSLILNSTTGDNKLFVSVSYIEIEG